LPLEADSLLLDNNNDAEHAWQLFNEAFLQELGCIDRCLDFNFDHLLPAYRG